MKARLPDLSSKHADADTRLNFLINKLEGIKKIPSFSIYCSPETQCFTGEIARSSVSKYMYRITKCNENDNPEIRYVCEATRAFIELVVNIYDSSDKEKYSSKLSEVLNDVCDLCVKQTLQSYKPIPVFVVATGIAQDSGLYAMLTQIETDFELTMDILNIYARLLYSSLMPDEFNRYIYYAVEAVLYESNVLNYLNEHNCYATAQLYKGLVPREYSADGVVLHHMSKSKCPFVDEVLVYDSLTKNFVNCTKREQLSFFYPNVEDMYPKKINSLHTEIMNKFYNSVLDYNFLIHMVSTELSSTILEEKYRIKEEELNKRQKEYEQEVRNRYRQKDSSSTKQQQSIVYVDRVVTNNKEADELRSKLAKYKARIESLETTIHKLEQQSLDISTLRKENELLLEYINAEEEEENEDSSELSNEDMELLSKMKAHLVVPDTHSLKQLRSILGNSNIVYTSEHSMFKQQVPSNYEVYLFCTGMCSHKSFYYWRNQVEDKNYTLCATVGIKSICKALLNAYKQEA